MKTSTLRTLVGISIASGLMMTVGSAVGNDSDASGKERDTIKVARSTESVAHDMPRIEILPAAGFEMPVLDPNPTQPKVLLSAGHQKTCLKQLGDQLETTSVKGIDGKIVDIAEELSDQFTVLVFWSENSVAGYEQFRRIPVDILSKFAAYRVKVVAVNVGGTVGETRRRTGNAGEMILSLADEDSSLFKQFATDHVPRTYVLDAEGRIVWFDIEYSESTRRSLSNALTYYIKQSQDLKAAIAN